MKERGSLLEKTSVSEIRRDGYWQRMNEICHFFFRQSDSLLFPPQQRSIRICDLEMDWGGAQLFFFLMKLFSHFTLNGLFIVSFTTLSKHYVGRVKFGLKKNMNKGRKCETNIFVSVAGWLKRWPVVSVVSIHHPRLSTEQLGLTSAHTGTWCGIQFCSCCMWMLAGESHSESFSAGSLSKSETADVIHIMNCHYKEHI